MVATYPKLPKDPNQPDEESVYGFNNNPTLLESPAPQQLYEKPSDDKNIDIGWIIQNEENNHIQEKYEDVLGLVGLLKKAERVFNECINCLVLISLLEIILIQYLFAAICVSKLILIIYCLRIGVVIEKCKAWATSHYEEVLNRAKWSARSLYECASFTTADGKEKTSFVDNFASWIPKKLSNDSTPRTVEFRRGERGLFGVKIRGTAITDVLEGSPASVNGVKKGDMIIYFNGIDIETLAHDQIIDLFHRVSGEIRLVLRYNPELLKDPEFER